LKTFLYYFFLVILFGCNTTSGEKTAGEDSLQYYPPTPGQMDQAAFRTLYRQVSGFVDSNLLARGFNGGILFAKDGQVIYERYTGRVDLRKQDSVFIDSTTSFHVASTSKTLTAVAILRLVQENKLSLQDSLQKFFPGFPYKGVTVKMLLNHRSGLPNYLYFMSNNKWGIGPDNKWNHQFATNQDVIDMMYEKIPDRTAAPDTRFHYSNTNFMLLATIIEKISGIPFPQYMKEKIFTPLHMDHSYIFTLADSSRATPTFTYNNTYWEFDFLDQTYGDKNLYTTPRDLLKFDQALYTEQLISKALQDSAFTPYSLEKKSIHNYGLGFRLQMLPNGKKIVYHFGKWHGSNAAFARLIDEKATIIILGNKFNRAIYDAAQQSYKIFGDYAPGNDEEGEESDSLKVKKSEIPKTKKKVTKKRG
jgi:CubicO group peptidase (beta-lactamase class C family)